MDILEDESKKDKKANNRWIFDYLATAWLIGMLIPGAYVGHEFINPVVFNGHPKWREFNSYLMYYGLFMLTSNWLLIRLTDNSVPKWYKPKGVYNENDYCQICANYKPPRSHHCNLCKTCVLKQDHHCFFAGKCVGYANQRYFVVFTFWMGLGFLYCLYIGLCYALSDQWRSLPWYDYVLLPLALLRFLLGYLSFYELLCLFLAHSLCVAVYGANFVFLSQTYLIYNGLTSYEKNKNLLSPVGHLPLKTLLKMTFGQFWFLNFLFPIGIFTKVYGKGYDWDDFINAKDV